MCIVCVNKNPKYDDSLNQFERNPLYLEFKQRECATTYLIYSLLLLLFEIEYKLVNQHQSCEISIPPGVYLLSSQSISDHRNLVL